jgi:hypothetical protein
MNKRVVSLYQAITLITLKQNIMATVYKVEIVSHWLSYHPKDLQKILEDALYNEDMNEVSVKVERQ